MKLIRFYKPKTGWRSWAVICRLHFVCERMWTKNREYCFFWWNVEIPWLRPHHP